MKELKVVFMGTPEFAVTTLKMLVAQQVNIVGVITAPDKPKGRGKRPGTSPVKDYAVSRGLYLLQPTNLKNQEFLDTLRALDANLQVVVAFRMLPKVVWAMPKMGTFNLHASLLPQYRGAAPINWAIINGETETGLTTFFLQHEIDTGSIIMQKKEPIHSDDTVGSLHDRLMHQGASLVYKTIIAIAENNYALRPQNEGIELKKAPKIFKDTCRISWNRNAGDIYNFIRGLSPYPGAWTPFNNRTLKVYMAKISKRNLEMGEIASDNKSYLAFGCNSGSIDILELQLEGKKRMRTYEFLRGHKL